MNDGIATRAGLDGSAANIPDSALAQGMQDSSAPPNLIPAGAQHITPQMLTLVELEQRQIDAIVSKVPGGASNVQDIYPLSPSQEGILFHRLLATRGDPYVLSTLFELQSREQGEALVAALQRVVDRHDVLRSAVLWEQLPLPVQVVQRQAPVRVVRLALDRNDDAVEQLKAHMFPDCQGFDICRAPLAQALIAADSSERWYAVLQLHHLACDDQSWRTALREVFACLDGQEAELPEPLAYRTYVAQARAQSRTQQAQAFFREKLARIDEPTAPFGLLEVHGDGSRTQEASRLLDRGLARQIRSQARRLGVSPARLFHAAWGLVVAQTSGREEVVFGTVLLTMRQNATAAQRMLGLSINTLPLRLQLQDASAQGLVEQTQRELIELLGHQHVSLTVAQQCSAIPGTAPLFTALLNYRHRPAYRAGESTTATPLRVIAQRGARTNYPLTLAVDDLGEEFALVVQTDPRIDPDRLANYVQTALQSLVEALEGAPQTRALSLTIIPEAERRAIESFGKARATYRSEKLIHQSFEEQAQRTPNALAATYEGRSLTYAELNARANQLARHLLSLGVGPDRLVGICVERGLDMVVGLLGILKAGGAYVPLDPGYPTERLCHMLQDASPDVVLIQEDLRAMLPDVRSRLIAIDSSWDVIATQPTANPDARQLGLRPDHLAYVMYTSGSTGKPKGVMVEHRNVTRLFAATEQWFDFGAGDIWTLFHSYAFDFSVWEMWGALFYGGRVVVVPHAIARSPNEFYRLLCDQGVTVLSQTPSAFAQLIDAQARDPRQHALRLVIFGGEALELRTLQPWVKRNGAQAPRLVNMYGITETTVHVTYRCLSADEIESERGSVIGQPIPDLEIRLLDRRQRPVAIGVAGEMYVGGAGVARGYLNRAELTAERFIADPADRRQGRLYKSGDLGRWRADGALEYLGRNDAQVKIRGFRIELGEIQVQLARHVQVKDGTVIAREDVAGQRRLVAYVVAADPADPPSAAVLRAHLRSVVPEHMVPSAFVVLERLPLTANGKLDRQSLPAPELDAFASGEYEAPQGGMEQALADIWRELLHVERVSRADNFFDLGGHSLLAMQLIARLDSVLSVEISMHTLFEVPTLKELAEHLARQRRANLLERISEGGLAVEELLRELTSMSDSKVEALLRELGAAAAK